LTAAPPRPRVLLAEDHLLVREGLRQLLGEHVEVVGAVGDGRTLLASADSLRPDIVLLDISMPQLNGFDAARQLQRAGSPARVIFVTMHADPDYVQAAFRAGARGYVVKSAASSELLAAIDAAMRGELYVSPQLAAAPGAPGRMLGDPLSPRQREVLQLVAEGRTAREIAEILALSRKTVEFHKASIMRLLGLHTTAELTRYALDHGLLGPV
jgi:DNA-binding NarL/FixJ family response regulator